MRINRINLSETKPMYLITFYKNKMTTTTTTTEMTNQDLLWRLQQLKSFKRARHKVHFLCKCDDTCIFVSVEERKLRPQTE